MGNPKVKIPLTFPDYALEIIGLGVFIGFWILTYYHYKALPYEVPTLYNSNGKIIEYGSKNTVLIPACIGTVLYVYFTIIGFFPHLYWKWAVSIVPANAFYQYRLGARFLRMLKILAINMIFGIGSDSMWYLMASIAIIVISSLVYSEIARNHR